LGIIIKITSEQNRRSVVKFSFMQQVEFFEDGRQILPYGRFGQTSAFDAPRYRAHDGMFVKVGYFKVGIRHSLPSLFSSTLHQVLVVYFLRHGGCHFRFHTFITHYPSSSFCNAWNEQNDILLSVLNQCRNNLRLHLFLRLFFPGLYYIGTK
jgi:hypothetical protein